MTAPGQGPVWLDYIEIAGYRGFSAPARIKLAVPDGATPGSGLTIMVGANGSGKSTALEVIRFLQKTDSTPQLDANKRNSTAQGRVTITYVSSSGKQLVLATGSTGGGGLQWRGLQEWDVHPNSVFTLSAHRQVPSQFAYEKPAPNSRGPYSYATGQLDFRSSQNFFSQRLIAADANIGDFNAVLERVMKPTPAPGWHVNPEAGGRAYLRIYGTSAFDAAAGLADGVASLFQIIDALYDSPAGDIIAIDELEESLHPTVQHNLLRELANYASQRQIIYTTHSPLLVDWPRIIAGAGVVRFVSDPGAIRTGSISAPTRSALAGILDDINNPHVLGPRASEILFLDDQIILVEGQQDVILYPTVFGQLHTSVLGTMFGWGVGGANKIGAIASLLKDLGYRRVAAIVDQDKAGTLAKLKDAFPEYFFTAIPANDVRTKTAEPAKREVAGLLDENKTIRPEHRVPMMRIVEELNHYFATGAHGIRGVLAFAEVVNPPEVKKDGHESP
jgi:hypothetical protein